MEDNLGTFKDILAKLKGHQIKTNTGIPTKDATSMTTVDLLSSFVLTKLGRCNSSLTVLTFAIQFINFGEGHTLD